MFHKKNPREVGQKYIFYYSECISDENGWIDSKRFLPRRYDLVYTQIKRNNKPLKRPIAAWWTGKNWEGNRIKKYDDVMAWKKKEDEDEY